MTEANTIIFTLHHFGESYQVQTSGGKYYSLMTLIVDELAIPGFGLCCGMGSCGTCLVHISDGLNAIKRPMLACGVLVNDDLANKHVFIPDKIY